MLEKPSASAENHSKESAVPTAIEMKDAIIELAGPRQWHATRETWIAAAAAKAGISYRAAKSLFYQECADPRSSVVDSVRAARAAMQQARRMAQDEHAELRARIAKLEAALLQSEKFDSPISDAPSGDTREHGRDGRALDN